MKADNNHIAFCVNEVYAPYLKVIIKSILENNEGGKLNFHILTDRISLKTRIQLEKIANPSRIYFYNVDDSKIADLFSGKFTKYAWYRLLLPAIIPIEINKILYLDADVICDGSLDDLFKSNIENKALSAVPDEEANLKEHYERCELHEDSTYFCSGVLLLNLDFWRKEDIATKVINWAKENKDTLVYPDQDAINHVCQNSVYLLPLKFGITTNMLFKEYLIKNKRTEIEECLNDPRIVHYNQIAPWYIECKHPLLFVWHKYNKMLGRSRIKQSFKYKIPWVEALKTRIWLLAHKNYFERYFGETESMIQKHLKPQ